MEADHALIQIQGKGGGIVDLIQGTFTQIKNITHHDHVQKPEAVTVFWHHPTIHPVTRARCLQLLNTSSTAHDQVPGIGRELQSKVYHPLAQTGETIEANHTLEKGGKGMKAGHSHVRKNGRGGGRDHVPIIHFGTLWWFHTHNVTQISHTQISISHTQSQRALQITIMFNWFKGYSHKEHYRSWTPSSSKARGSHSHMYSGFYSSDILQTKHHPRSLSWLPVHSWKNCYKLSDTSPEKPCETSQSQLPSR